MAYDVPGGGVGRLRAPCGASKWPRDPYGQWCAVRRYRALRGPAVPLSGTRYVTMRGLTGSHGPTIQVNSLQVN
eukprot:3216746-Prymnesium_polylepis.1